MSEPRPRAFINARLVDPATETDGRGGLLVRLGRIEAVGPGFFNAQGISPDYERIDCGGHVLAPGLVDMAVSIGEPGAEHKETIGSASLAGAAGGVTTLIMMPNTDPVIDDASLVDFVRRRARDTAVVRVHPMAALTKGTEGNVTSEMALLGDAGAVGFTDGPKSIANTRVFRRALEYSRSVDGLVVHHAQDEALAAGGQMNEGELSTRLGLQGIPAEAESIIVERDMALVGLTGARYHLAQISCPQSLETLRRAKDRGLKVTAATTPHHLALNEIDIATYRTFHKTLPPLRSEPVRLALVEALREGLIDVVASHHDPRGPEEKRLPFEEAAFGAVGLESLLPVLLELVHGNALPLTTALRAVTSTPADLLGLHAGRLATGRPADLVLIDLDEPYIFGKDQLLSKSKNTPFDGRRFQGRAALTTLSGRIVHSRLKDYPKDAA
ncbi:MAG: dihydroorotase [Pseudomonadota bacterium]